MNESYWDSLSDDYETQVFEVLRHDRDQLVLSRVAHHGSPDHLATDLGCGIGDFTPFLAEHFGQVEAVDLSRKFLDRACERCGDLDNVTFRKVDLASQGNRLPKAHFALCVNVLIMPSLAVRRAILQAINDHLLPGGVLLLVVPSLESAMLSNARLIDWNLRDGVPPTAAARAESPAPKPGDAVRMKQGIMRLDDVPTKHYVREEIVARLEASGLRVREATKIEYTWDTEFTEPPRWMQEPFPWDWLVLAEKASGR